LGSITGVSDFRRLEFTSFSSKDAIFLNRR
jgi:hypothetical protein